MCLDNDEELQRVIGAELHRAAQARGDEFEERLRRAVTQHGLRPTAELIASVS